MRVLHVTPAFAPAYRYGGPIETVLRLCLSLQRAGVGIDVITTTANGDEDLTVKTHSEIDVEGLRVRYFPRWGTTDYAFSPALVRWLAAHVRRYDLVHITSTFSFPALAAGIVSRVAGIPYVVSPHGSLQSWSLRQKRWKKLPYWLGLEGPHLRRASAIHATAEFEEEEVRRLLPTARIFTIANGSEKVSIPSVMRDERRIVFLGRIHKKKGLDVLIPALSEVANSLPDVETIVAGPDDEGEWSRVQTLIESANPRPRVRYIGPVYGQERFRLLASAAAFVLPSHSENFGMTVVEAMACRTAVVVSRNCPWSILTKVGAGMWVENTPADVAAALLRLLRDGNLRERMGAAGANLAAKFSWDALAQEMAAKYRELLSDCPG